jgi:hypothetical protein
MAISVPTGLLLHHEPRGTITSQTRVKGYETALTAGIVPLDPAFVVTDLFDEQWVKL